MSVLKIDFAGEEVEVSASDSLTFGRDADLEVDTNRYLHRRVGVFQHRAGSWWLSNIGSAIALEVCDSASPSRMTISPGASAPVPFRDCLVRFQAGPVVYELVITQPSSNLFPTTEEALTGLPTITSSNVTLNEEQRLLLVALAATRLRDRGSAKSAIPPNRVVSNQLGWSTTKFNRKLDNLCAKFDRLGVAGLKGDSSGLASKRRERLVDHVLTVGLISDDDLVLLEESTS